MPKLNIDGVEIEMETFDCKDKVVVLTIPAITSGDRVKAIKQLVTDIRQTCGAREVIAIPKYVSFKTRSVDKTIHILDRLIKKLDSDKRKLVKMEEQRKNVKKQDDKSVPC